MEICCFFLKYAKQTKQTNSEEGEGTAPACVEQPLAASPGWLKRKQAQDLVECDDALVVEVRLNFTCT